MEREKHINSKACITNVMFGHERIQLMACFMESICVRGGWGYYDLKNLTPIDIDKGRETERQTGTYSEYFSFFPSSLSTTRLYCRRLPRLTYDSLHAATQGQRGIP